MWSHDFTDTTFCGNLYFMKRIVEQQPSLQTYPSLDYIKGLNDALSRYGHGESIIN